VRDDLCWNCWEKRKEDAKEQESQANQPPPAEESAQPLAEFPAHLNTRGTLIAGTLRLYPDRVRFVLPDHSELAKAHHSVDLSIHEVAACDFAFTSAGVVNGITINVSPEEFYTFVCDHARAAYDALDRLIKNRPEQPHPQHHQAEHVATPSGRRVYRCPQCEGENPWSAMLCIHCNVPLPAHSLVTDIKILYSDQPFLMLLIGILLGMGILALLIKLVVG